MGSMILKFELDLYFCTVHLPPSFILPMFNRSAVTVFVLFNKHVHK